MFAKEQLIRAKEDLQSLLKSESSELKVYINRTRDEVNQHREELQTKYNEKLSKVKEVCAQFFNRFEKELIGSQDKMKDMEKRIEEWAQLIVKP